MMDGRAFAQGIAGFNQGVEIGQAQVARREAARRQAGEDAWQSESRDRQRKTWAAEDAAQELSARQRQLMARFGQVAAMGDNPTSAKAIMDLYNAIPDGQAITEPPQRLEDGTWMIKHPVGELRGSWNEMMFGQTDPETGSVTRLGLVHLIDPQLLLKNQHAVAAELPKAARDRQNNQSRLDVANVGLEGRRAAAGATERAAQVRAGASIRAAEINAQGRVAGRAPVTQVGEDGVLYQWDGQVWAPASMADGTPLRPQAKPPAAPKPFPGQASDGSTQLFIFDASGRPTPLTGPDGSPILAPPQRAGAPPKPLSERIAEQLARSQLPGVPINQEEFRANVDAIVRATEAASGGAAATDDELTLRPGETPRQARDGKWYVERNGRFFEVIP